MSAKLIVIERCLIVLGLICLSLFAMSRLHAAYGEQAAIDDVNLNRGVGRVIPSRGMNGEGNLSLASLRFIRRSVPDAWTVYGLEKKRAVSCLFYS
ncbi:hypothetical protein KT99_12949 [Shewanella benthica KT99]|uniref:Uncharacterized protein n=1 Tax=Shewanella benthica KT99 TaxID=314608 RepID=A9CZC5_9GAMM|nr:hypothetical protein KT99_12949 [Shewanella benthica KT99]